MSMFNNTRQLRAARSGSGLSTRNAKLVLAVAAVLGASASQALAVDGTWVTNGSAFWNDPANWSGAVIADGTDGIAHFETIDITADTTVTLGADRTIGSLIFGDTDIATAGSWIIAAGNTLTLSGAAPTITVNTLGTGKSATIAAPIAGTGYTKSGDGRLILTNENTGLSGTVVITGGILTAGTNGNFTTSGLGTAGVNLKGGATLNTSTAAGNTWLLNAVNVDAGQVGNITMPNRVRFNGAVTGGGTLNLAINSASSRTDLQNSFVGFTGNLNLTGTGNVRMGIVALASGQPNFNVNSWASTTMDLGGSVSLAPTTNSGGNTIPIGSLAGSSATASLAGGTAGTATWSIGALNTSTTYAGLIGAGAVLNAGITKTGTGTLTLSNPALAYTGGTVVSGGALKFTGAKTGAGTVTVNNTGTLTGTASIAGTTTVNSGGKVSADIGTVNNTFTLGALTLGAGSLADYEFGSGNDLINVTGALTVNGGSLSLYDVGTTNTFSTNGVYSVFTFGSIAGTGLSALTVANTVVGKLYTFGTSGSTVTLTIADAAGAPGFWNISTGGSWAVGSNWTGGVSPNAIGAFAGLGGGGTPIAGNSTVSLNGSKTVGTLSFNNSSFSFTVAQGSGGSLILDNSGTPAAVTVAAGTHTISAPIVLTAGGAGLNVVGATDVLNVSGGVSGPAGLTIAGAGTVNLSGTASTYTGTTTVSGGTLSLGASNLLPSTTDLSVASILNMNSNSQSVNTLNGAGAINNLGALAVANGGTFSGAIGGTGPITANGGTLTLTNTANAYTGGTVINNSAVSIGTVFTGTPLGTGTVTFNNGTLNSNNGGGNLTLVNPLFVTAATTNTLNLANGTTARSVVLPAGVTGSGTLNIVSNNGQTAGTKTIDFGGNNAAFAGTVNFTSIGVGGTQVRFTTANAGSALGTFSIANGIFLGTIAGASGTPQTISLGNFSGPTGTALRGHSSSGGGSDIIWSIGALNADSTYSGSIANGSNAANATGLAKVGTGTLTLDGDDDTYTGPTNVNGGTLVIAGNYLPVVGAKTILTVASGANLNVNGTAQFSAANVVGTGVVKAAGVVRTNALTLDTAASKVDLSLGSLLVVDYTGSSPNTTIQGYAKTGIGTKSGVSGLYSFNSAGITSSTIAAANVLAGFNQFSIGVVDTADLALYGQAPFSNFAGVDGDSVIARYTYSGDANLDGKIDSADYALINAGFAGTIPVSKGWIAGDFDYSGVVDATDYAIIDFGFLKQTSVLGVNDPVAVPEPTSLALLALGSAALMGRRRRQA